MGQLHLIIIKKNKIYHTPVGFRFVISLLNRNLFYIDKLLRIIKRRYYTDRGYILIDLDKKIILSNQTAFSSCHLNNESRKRLQKEFDFHEVI